MISLIVKVESWKHTQNNDILDRRKQEEIFKTAESEK